MQAVNVYDLFIVFSCADLANLVNVAALKVAKDGAKSVGNAFIQQYYHILHQSPGLVHRFYQDISKLGRLEEDGSMSITTTMDAINAKILSLNYGDFKAEIKSVDAQESLNGGVSVLVTGYMTGMDNIQQQFTQSFFLAPQDKGYFVLNDMFRYMNIDNHHDEDHAPTEDVVASATPEQVSEVVPVPENNIPEQVAVLTEESEVEPAVLVENGEVPVVEEDPVPEVVDEVQDSSQLAVESHTKVEEMPKKSYASIVMDMKQNGVPFSSPAPAPRKPQPRKQEQHLNIALPTNVAAEPVASNADAVENTLHEEEVEGYSVYIKGLPMNATHALLEEEFKKFGPIKPNGIQIRNNRGFYFGFVEFEVPDAVQKAIEASPITINGKNAVVEEKRSTISKAVKNRVYCCLLLASVSISTSSSSTLYKPSTTLN
ncbi:nuclear transport factor 2 [Helianthus annuus]|uniref:nuclear transport factor 2 n=2 Tax=Helianthus annuus TaxID=4232 RepID=UPI0016531D0B|nr:nuclear transport factor 2 [Helianthus annuus]